MKSVTLVGPASAELTDAVRWYEGRRTGLGGQFFDAVTSTLDQIQQHPQIGRELPHRGEARRMLVFGFPYSVVYRERAEVIQVIAIAHAKRRPDYWKRRQ